MAASVAAAQRDALATFPEWVPKGAQNYLAHTEGGKPIRVLARAAGCHASTILRQIRKIEMQRDDPLVDAALRQLSATQRKVKTGKSGTKRKENQSMSHVQSEVLPDEDTLSREALRILRRLCEPGAVLAVAADMDKAVVVRDCEGRSSTRTAVVTTKVAQAMALKNWITATSTGRIVRYQITPAGRSEVSAMLKDNAKGQGGAGPDHLTGSDGATDDDWNVAEPVSDDGFSARSKYTLGESPLITLARRRDRNGAPFLTDALVHAGERLREDFELGQMEGQITQNWDHFLTAGTHSGHPGRGPIGHGPSAARARVAAAFCDLGPGLSDIVLRCCCYLEGLETAEKRLDWSARSAKIVLRIALMRLKRHYDETVGPGGPMIG